MATVTVPELRRLAKLYRSGIDGAAERLTAIIAEEKDELPELLGFPRPNLTRLLSSENAAELLVATIEGAPKVTRDAKNRARRAEAREHAVTLGANAEHRPDGTILLPLELLHPLVAVWPGSGLLVLGDRGSVDIARLRALLRECRGVTSLAVVVTETAVVVAYTATGARGLVRLHLRPILHHVDAVVVPLPTLVERAASVTNTEASMQKGTPLGIAEPIEIGSMPPDLDPIPEMPSPVRPVAPVRPWAHWFLDALAEAIGGVS